MTLEKDVTQTSLPFYLNDTFGEYIEDSHHFNGETHIKVSKDHLLTLIRLLREDKNLFFNQLTDICGVDHLEAHPRFQIVYHFLSHRFNLRLRVSMAADEGDILPSITSLHKAAGWYEREIWDLFGLAFSGHSDLRRILTDYGFSGHPLRKDFPLTGESEVRYDPVVERVTYGPLNLPQAYRDFQFQSPWNGPCTDGVLPGDEKAAPLNTGETT